MVKPPTRADPPIAWPCHALREPEIACHGAWPVLLLTHGAKRKLVRKGVFKNARLLWSVAVGWKENAAYYACARPRLTRFNSNIKPTSKRHKNALQAARSIALLPPQKRYAAALDSLSGFAQAQTLGQMFIAPNALCAPFAARRECALDIGVAPSEMRAQVARSVARVG